MSGCIIKFYDMICALVGVQSLSLLVKPWIISDMLAVIQVKFHAEAQSLKEELETTNSKLLSMEEVTKCLLTPKLAGNP
jgi:hypothetical protein